MIRIIDSSPYISSCFNGGEFSLSLWKKYAENTYPGLSKLCMDDMEETIRETGFTFQNNYLPVISAANDSAALEDLVRTFRGVTNGLDERIKLRFGKEADSDIVLYLGLCSGAGWVTELSGRRVILLGIEKILELGWTSEKAMCGLIFHELGHIFQAQYGVLERETDNTAEGFIWQLFTEGIAMCFEQMLVGDDDFFHQDEDGWKNWCDGNFLQILADFDNDLSRMSRSDQRWFGDWVKYCGRGDVGYYIGARFVKHLMSKYDFMNLLGLEAETVCGLYRSFAENFRAKN